MEVTTYDVISDLWANNQVEDAHLLSKLLVSAKQGNVQAIKDILELAQPSWLGELKMETVSPQNWKRKIDQLRRLWTQAMHRASEQQS
jgi:hypothetical protein